MMMDKTNFVFSSGIFLSSQKEEDGYRIKAFSEMGIYITKII